MTCDLAHRLRGSAALQANVKLTTTSRHLGHEKAKDAPLALCAMVFPYPIRLRWGNSGDWEAMRFIVTIYSSGVYW
jgi:hypothetical protein